MSDIKAGIPTNALNAGHEAFAAFKRVGGSFAHFLSPGAGSLGRAAVTSDAQLVAGVIQETLGGRDPEAEVSAFDAFLKECSAEGCKIDKGSFGVVVTRERQQPNANFNPMM